MGNYRFRLSDMIPNSWFYKLREIGGRGRSSNGQTILDSKKKPPPAPPPSANTTPPSDPKHPPPQSCSRKSYYITRELDSNEVFSGTCYFPEPPRKSSKQERAARRRRTATRSTTQPASSSVSAGGSCRTTVESIWTKSDSPLEFSTSTFDSFHEPEFRTDTCLAASDTFYNDEVIGVDKESLTTTRYHDVVGAFDSLLELELPPIITKHDSKKKESRQRTSPTRKLPANSPGVRLRVHSPKIANRKINQASGRRSVSSRRSLSDSFAVMKSSYDPQRDFRESMVEMIVENNIWASKDLEDLLACYLSLNADEYHDLIIKVFKQIWLDLMETGN